MFKDVGQFIIIWIFVLFGFSSVGIITLNRHPRMKTFSSSLLFFFEVAFGNYDLDSIEEIWGDQTYFKTFAKYIILLFLFLNAIILLNVVIAMMASTYGLMTSLSVGIYNHSVIRAAPAYKNDKYYGSLAFW